MSTPGVPHQPRKFSGRPRIGKAVLRRLGHGAVEIRNGFESLALASLLVQRLILGRAQGASQDAFHLLCLDEEAIVAVVRLDDVHLDRVGQRLRQAMRLVREEQAIVHSQSVRASACESEPRPRATSCEMRASLTAR